MKGYTGKILIVHLDTGDISEKVMTDYIYENLLSGLGLGAYYLLKNIPSDADPMGPDNILGFVSGLLTGSGSLMTGRWLAVCKSPLTGGFGDANCGGFFSPAIKQCGYDGIFFHGISDDPVYLYVDNKGAELRNAEKYWGMDATDAENELIKDCMKKGVKKVPRVAVIGEAGEKLSYISGICTDGGRIAARSGVGAVMGSKNLKAVVLAGSKPIQIAEPETMKKLNNEFADKIRKSNMPPVRAGGAMALLGRGMGKMTTSGPMDGGSSAMLLKRWGTPMNTPLAIRSGDAPIKNWAGSSKDISRKFVGAYNPDKIIDREYRKYHCYSCAIGCGGVLSIKDVGHGEYSHTHKPEYETLDAFGPLLMNENMETVLYINELLNRAGMDSISAGSVIAYAIECYDRGILKSEHVDGLELNWGNSDAIVALIKKMIKRQGIGNILADGTKKATEHLGTETLIAAMHVGGQEPGMHDSRMDPQLGLHYVADPTPGKHTGGSRQSYNALALHLICSWVPKPEKEKKQNEYIPSEKEALKSVGSACYKMMLDGAGGCYYAMLMGNNNWKLVDLLNAATGWNYTGDQYMEIGKRIQTMRQLFNAKHHVDIAGWTLPDRMAGKPPLNEGPLKGRTLQNEDMLKLHWKAFGWDGETGIPTKETIEQLKLNTLLEEVDTDGEESSAN